MGELPARALVFTAPPSVFGTTSVAIVVTDGNSPGCPSAFAPVPSVTLHAGADILPTHYAD